MTKLSITFEHRKKVAKERLEVCNGCEKYNHTTTQCHECGCVMLIKTLLASSVCPLNKWNIDETEIKKE